MQLKLVQLVGLLSLSVLVASCAYNTGFGFPIERGDIDAGRQAFIDHQCHQCHSISGVNLPALAGAPPPVLVLGGDTTVVRTFAGLVTSIINPNHVISERYREQLGLDAAVTLDSPMPMPNIETMSVRQLIDLVTLLDSRYVLIEDYEPET